MTSPKTIFPRNARPGSGRRVVALALVAAMSLFSAMPASCAGDESDQELSARRLYNVGTSNLNVGKLSEAESYLQSAVESQDERVQPTALYNLGLTRFQQGARELTNAPDPAALEAQSTHATQNGASALHAANDALAGNDLQALVDAYLRGRGARHDLKGAIDAVQRAIDTYGVVLAKWRRASGDFHSTVELRPQDLDAQTNADLTDRYIAELLDRLKLMMQRKAGMQQQREELRKAVAMLKGRIPDWTGPPMLGDDGDDDEDGKKPPRQPQAGDQEGPVKNGQEMTLTFEEARRLLGLLQLDTGRKLYLGGDQTPKPRDPKARDW
jgi:tetratricopeptide (TPR) repeat protein